MFAFFVLVAVVILSAVLSFMVYKSKPASATNRLFALFGCSIMFWSVIMYLSLQFESASMTLFFIRMSMLAGTILAICALLFAHTFPSAEFSFPKWAKVFLLIMGPLTMITAMSPYMFTDIIKEGSNIEPTAGPGILLFLITAVGSVFATFVILIAKFIKAKSIQKTQYFFMIVGIMLMFVLLLTTNFVTVILFKDSSLIFLAPVYPLLFLGSTAYAIFRHKLLDIKLLVVRALSYTITIGVLAAFFFLTLVFFTSVITGFSVDTTEVIFITIFSIAFSFLFQPVRMVFERITEKYFYRGSYDMSQALDRLGRTISSTLVYQELTDTVKDIFTKYLKAASFEVVLFEDLEGKGIHHSVASGSKDRELLIKFLKTVFKQTRDEIILDEVEDEKIEKVMKLFELNIVFPLTVNNRVIGACLVGHKSSGDTYSNRDFSLMKIIAPQLAIGVQNALSYEEIRRFNFTLQERIEKATSKLKDSNKKLKESYEKLQQLDRLKDEFVSIASHELRTPLTAIKGYMWLALHKSPVKLPEIVQKNLQIALDANERLSRMVEDMLTISRIEGKRLVLNRDVTDLFTLAQEVYEELDIKAQAKNITFTLNQNGSNLKAEVDKEKIREVLINIIGNALKFTPEKGSIQVWLEKVKNSIVITVKDSGPGIEKKDIPKLFQKFVRLSRSYEKTKESGSGLGLYITKQIIDLHKGEILINSEIAKGTTFTISLPCSAS